MAENIRVTIVDPNTGAVSYHNIPASEYREESYATGSVQRIEYVGSTGPGGWPTDTSRKVLYERPVEERNKLIDRKIIEQQQAGLVLPSFQPQPGKGIQIVEGGGPVTPPPSLFLPKKEEQYSTHLFERPGRIEALPVITHTKIMPGYTYGTSTPGELKKVGRPSPGILTPVTGVKKIVPLDEGTDVHYKQLKAEAQAEKEITKRTMPFVSFADIVAQKEYNRLMTEKARSEGLTWDTGRKTWLYTDEKQLEAFKAYDVEARRLASEKANLFYQQQIKRMNIEDIYKKRYAEVGLAVYEKEGKQYIVSDEEFNRLTRFDWEKAGIERRMSGKEGIKGHALEFGRFWYSGFTPENFAWSGTISEAVWGEKDIAGQLAGTYQSIEASRKTYGWAAPYIKPYEPGGAGFYSFLLAVKPVTLVGKLALTGVFVPPLAWEAKEIVRTHDVKRLGSMAIQISPFVFVPVGRRIGKYAPEMEIPSLRSPYPEPVYGFRPKTIQVSLEQISQRKYLYTPKVLELERSFIDVNKIRTEFNLPSQVKAKSISPYIIRPKTVEINLLGEKVVRKTESMAEPTITGLEEKYKYSPFRQTELKTYIPKDYNVYYKGKIIGKAVEKPSKRLRYNESGSMAITMPLELMRKPTLEWGSEIVSKISKNTGRGLWVFPVVHYQSEINIKGFEQGEYKLGTIDVSRINFSEMKAQRIDLGRISDIQMKQASGVFDVDMDLMSIAQRKQSMNIQGMVSVQGQRYEQRLKYVPRSIPKTELRLKEPFKFMFVPGISLEETKKKQRFKQGFDVFVKERSYVKGRKRYPERWRKVNTNPLSMHDALSLGGSAVDNSAAASFKIKPMSNKKARPLKIQVSDWNMLDYKFYKKGNTYIEGTNNRIDSQGEIMGISAKGWLANQKKQGGMGFGW